ncbi:MAG: roadblock/LC7 domain-containing protein [Pyrinomonadaceae bacterium]
MNKEQFRKAIDQTEGCVGLLVFSYDGYATDEFWKHDANHVAEYFYAVSKFAPAVRLAVDKGNNRGSAQVSMMTIETDSAIFLSKPIDSELFLVMIMSPEGNLGKARYELNEVALEFSTAALV